jgi:hypothetical protein
MEPQNERNTTRISLAPASGACIDYADGTRANRAALPGLRDWCERGHFRVGVSIPGRMILLKSGGDVSDFLA